MIINDTIIIKHIIDNTVKLIVISISMHILKY